MSKIEYNRTPETNFSNSPNLQATYSTSVVRPGYEGLNRREQVYAVGRPQPVMAQTRPAPYVPQPTFAPATYAADPHLVPVQNYIPADHQPTYGYSPHISYSGDRSAPLYPHSHVHGQAHPKASQRYVTYYPYTRYYTDYEEQTVMVPVEKTRTKYAQKIIETSFVPKKVEEVVMEVEPVQKQQMRVEYVPVQKKIIHLPKDEKNFQVVHPQKHKEMMEKLREKQSRNQNESIVNEYQQAKRESNANFRQSHIQEVYPNVNTEKRHSTIDIVNPNSDSLNNTNNNDNFQAVPVE